MFVHGYVYVYRFAYEDMCVHSTSISCIYVHTDHRIVVVAIRPVVFVFCLSFFL